MVLHHDGVLISVIAGEMESLTTREQSILLSGEDKRGNRRDDLRLPGLNRLSAM